MLARRSFVPTVVLVLSAGLVALLVYGVVHGGDNRTLDDAVKQGRRPVAPGATIKLPMLQGGGQRSLADYRGQVVVLNFWASWCVPCTAEAPVLQRGQEALAKAHAGTVLGATFDDAPSDALDFSRREGLTYPSMRDLGTKLAQKYGTDHLPETFVIDRHGRVVAISRGQLRQTFLDNAIRRAQAS